MVINHFQGEIGVFFPLNVLRSLEGSECLLNQKLNVLRMLEKVCKDSQMLVDIYVNYDCCLQAPNLFERVVITLSRIAQRTQNADPNSVVASQMGSIKGSSVQQQQQVRMDLIRRSKSMPIQEAEKSQFVVLDLSGMSLDSLPNPSINLGLISKLDLSNNNLQIIPESLTARLLNVVMLDVHSNQLKALPNSIGCLSKLKVFNVSGNHLQSFPKTIENCRSLEELNANFNMLTRLPDTLGFELVNLKKLSVNSNKLLFLPTSTSHLTNLCVLDARLNCLRSLPDDLENLINLQILNISQNFQHLATLPYSIGLLISLVELDVSYNKITTLPDSIGCLKKLQKLSVEGNPLVSPPMDVVEQGLYKVKEYLTEKMNGRRKTSPKKKSWIGKLKKYGTFNGANNIRVNVHQDHQERQGFIPADYNQIETLASPRYTGMFSPRRFFSPKTYFSR